MSFSVSGSFSLQSSMEWPGDFPEDRVCEGLLETSSEQFQKDIKEKLNPNTSRSVKVAKAST